MTVGYDAASLVSALLGRTLAPVALVYTCTPLEPMTALAVVFGLKLGLAAFGRLCRAAVPHKKGEKGLRVLIVGDSFAPKLDGPQFINGNLIKQLARDGHIAHVFCSNGYPGVPSGPEQWGATVTRGPGIEVFPKHKVTLPSPVFIYTLLTFRPHIVHLSDYNLITLALAPLTWALGVPTCLVHHSRVDLYGNFAPGILGVLGPKVTRTLFEVLCQFASGHLLGDVSQSAQSWLHGLRTRGWVTGCDSTFFHPKNKNAEVKSKYMGHRPDLPLGLFVGRLDPQKQCELIPDIIAAVNPPGQPEVCRFLVIGDGPSAPAMRETVEGRADVVMPGIVKGQPVAECFATADFFFSPTVTGTLDMVWLESMASGLPCVAPRAVAVPQVITDGVNGTLYEPCDPEAAARAIKKLIPMINEKMKVECRRLAEEKFTHVSAMRYAVEWYEALLE